MDFTESLFDILQQPVDRSNISHIASITITLQATHNHASNLTVKILNTLFAFRNYLVVNFVYGLYNCDCIFENAMLIVSIVVELSTSFAWREHYMLTSKCVYLAPIP